MPHSSSGSEAFVIRALRPEDARAYSQFMSRIEASDARRRFLDRSHISPSDDAARYTRLDPGREFAFVALRQSPQGEEIVGEVRAHRYPQAAVAEIAIIVRSDMKRRGLGRALMQTMTEHCKAQRLEMIAQILPENTAMLRLAERCGMTVEHPPGGKLVIAHKYP